MKFCSFSKFVSTESGPALRIETYSSNTTLEDSSFLSCTLNSVDDTQTGGSAKISSSQVSTKRTCHTRCITKYHVQSIHIQALEQVASFDSNSILLCSPNYEGRDDSYGVSRGFSTITNTNSTHNFVWNWGVHFNQASPLIQTVDKWNSVANNVANIPLILGYITDGNLLGGMEESNVVNNTYPRGFVLSHSIALIYCYPKAWIKDCFIVENDYGMLATGRTLNWGGNYVSGNGFDVESEVNTNSESIAVNLRPCFVVTGVFSKNKRKKELMISVILME